MNNNMQQQTTINIQEKANLIWAIADKLVGVYKPHEYGNVILPMCVIKRFEDTLAPTKQAVLDTNAKLDKDGIVVKKGFLETAFIFTKVLSGRRAITAESHTDYLWPVRSLRRSSTGGFMTGSMLPSFRRSRNTMIRLSSVP